MKRKQIIIGIVVVACAGLGLYVLVRSHGETTASGDEEENTPSIVSVQTGALKLMTLHNYVSGYGTVEAAPATTGQPAGGAQLAAPGAGIVTKVDVIEGQQVQKGDVLVELNSGAVTFAYANAEVQRQKILFEQNNTSLKNVQDAEAQLAAVEVVAPVVGTVTRINVRPGMAVDTTTAVAEVVDLNRLAITMGIPASEAGDLKTGADVQVQTDPPVTATLSFVSPSVDPNNGTVLTRALLPADSGLRPGQFVQLKIVTATHTHCLAAPAESVVTDEEGKSVIALVQGDSARQTDVKTGFRENGWVEVEGEGLQEGDTVVTVGAYGLPEKTKIEVVNPSAEKTSTTNSEPAEVK